MAHADKARVAQSYGDAATRYSDAWQPNSKTVPHAALEKELVRRMLGDCHRARVLDIAGGSGNHARQAVEAGAESVDVVDISAGFMQVGKDMEAQLGRSVISWHLANAYKPLADQAPALQPGSYDVALAIWAFDHVASVAELEALWANIATYLKSGGRLVAVRVDNPKAASAADEPKYGVKYHGHRDIEGGLSYTFSCYTDPAFHVQASSMRASYEGSTELAEKAGIVDVKLIDFEDMETVKADRAFWALLLQDPYWVGFTARRK